MRRGLRRSAFHALSLLVVLSGFGFRAAAQEGTSPPEERDIEQQRSEWFYGQRAYPQTHVPSGAHQRALKQLDQKLASEAAARLRGGGFAANPSWSSIGPQPIDTPFGASVVSGRVTAFAIDPSNTSIVYLGGAQGGVWKTTDGGANWTPLTDTQASLAIGSIVLDPTNSSTIYVGTGEENFSGDSYYGEGILKSTDGGMSWTQICGPFCGPVANDGFFGGGARIGGIAVDPGNNQILLAAVALVFKYGIYRSTDGGTTWTQVLSGDPGTAVIFDSANAGVAYAALGDSFTGGTKGVYKSTNAGQSWTAMNGTGANVLPIANAGRIVLAISPSTTTTLYAGIADVNTGNLIGFFKTNDGGSNWLPLSSTPDYCTPQCSYDNIIAVQPTNANVIYAGGAFSTTLIRSLDGGSTWSVLQSAKNNGTVHGDMHALAFTPDGGTLYLGNDGGAYSTTPITATNPTFNQLNATLSLTQMYPGLSIDPANVAHAIGGTQDNGTVLYTGSLAWNDVTCGDGGYTAIDAMIPSTMYATCPQINIQKSTSSGTAGTWNAAQNGVNTADRVDFIPPLIMDPAQSNTLYFGTFRVYQTTNGASTWAAISPDLTNGSGFWAVITSIAVAPTDSNTVYAGTGDSHVQVTTNAGAGTGATWNDRSTGLPPRVLTKVAVDPTTSTTAYVTFSGFTGFGDSLGHVFKTTNGGTSWTDISADMPNTPVTAILVDPDAPNNIFVGTDVGVFYTTTGGASWTSLVNGLPRLAVLGLTLHNPSRTLRASTHGRGVWDVNIASLLPLVSITSISPSSTTAGGAMFNLTVNGDNFDNTSVVRWNGANLSTAFVNSGQLTATVPASDITAAGSFQVTVFNASSNQTSNPATFTVNNPLPVLTSLSPNSATALGPAFTLTANGSKFVNGSVVEWNGSPRTTTFVSSTQVTAMITAADIGQAGTAQVTVFNSGGGGTSSALPFKINNPVPVVTSLSPNSKLIGSPAFTLIVNGSKFVKGAGVQFNGNNRTTTFVSSTQVKASILAGDSSTVGVFPVTVANPTPGGGTSNSVNFTVKYPAPKISSLVPPGTTAGRPAFTITINGSNFFAQSVAKWNGSPRTTTFVSGTQLKAAIAAADIAKGQNANVSATNPSPGGGTATATFVVSNPVPAITSIAPNKATHGGPGFKLTVTGSNFVPGSAVKWNGAVRTTTFVSSTQVTASILASDIASTGTPQVTVFNSTPGGGTSNAVTFTIQ